MKVLAGIGVAGLVLGLFANEARAEELPDPFIYSRSAAVALGINVRNGDWVTVNAMGMVLLGPPEARTCAAVTARAEVGIGGSGAGIGLGVGPFPEGCVMPNFLFSGIISLEAHVERMYFSTWPSATYVGPQVTFSWIWMKISIAAMHDINDSTNKQGQLGFGMGW